MKDTHAAPADATTSIAAIVLLTVSLCFRQCVMRPYDNAGRTQTFAAQAERGKSPAHQFEAG